MVQLPERCTYRKPDNYADYDYFSAKKRDTGTFNMLLVYIIFTNDLP